jgi:alanine racemase
MAVFKADGYGHGAITVAQAAIAAGAERLGTTDVAEASKLRAAGLTVPILTWLNPSGVDAEAAATDQIDVEVGSVGELDALVKHAPSRVRVHLNMDTGMAREGCPMRERDTLIARARQGKAGEDPRRVPHRAAPVGRPGEPEANTLAVSRMRQARRAVMAAGFDAPLTNLAATSGTDGGVAWPRRPAVTPATSPTTPSAKIALPLGLVDVKVAA